VLGTLSKATEVHGLAHITGGAFTKLTRLQKNVRFNLNDMPKPLPVFKLIQTHAKVNDREMYSTFNMGIGFCAIAPKNTADDIIKIFGKYKMRSSIIGKIDDGKGVYIGKSRIA
jgi:phosphoribosylformylglycinamidine cyclo-ligase